VVNMHFISHRGNINGPNAERENEPSYLLEAIALGFDIEVDIWFHHSCSLSQGMFYLGHDFPQYPVDNCFIEEIKNKSWFHCKNLEALNKISIFNNINYFWHQNDDFTLTSAGYIWSFPGRKISDRSILLTESIDDIGLKICAGVCSDYISLIYDNIYI
jgi:hypothetical protein